MRCFYLPKKYKIEKCPVCHTQPEVWHVPSGQWYIECKNCIGYWHPKIRGESISEFLSAVKSWNKAVDDYIASGVQISPRRENKRQEYPVWIKTGTATEASYTCSECGYTLAPPIQFCPGCRRRIGGFASD